MISNDYFYLQKIKKMCNNQQVPKRADLKNKQ